MAYCLAGQGIPVRERCAPRMTWADRDTVASCLHWEGVSGGTDHDALLFLCL
jgi:hypothetical protein